MTHRQTAIYQLGVAIGHLNSGHDHKSLANAEFHVALALLEMAKSDPDKVACDMLIAALEQEKKRRALLAAER
jgi:hypothetical protein